MSVVGDFLSGGNQKNEELTDNLYDWQETIHKSEAAILEESGAMSADEAAAYLEDALNENDKNRDEAMREIKRQTNTNIALNIANAVLSCVGVGKAMGAVKGISTAAKGTSVVAAGAKGAMNATTVGSKVMGALKSGTKSVLGNISNETVRNVLTTGARSVYKLGGAVNKGVSAVIGGAEGGLAVMSKGAGRMFVNSKTILGKGVSGTLWAATTAGKFALPLAPTIASQLYTRSKSNAITEELTQTINTLTNTASFLETNRENMNQEMSDTYGKWSENYEANTADLYQQLQDGKITQAQYNERYETLVKNSEQELQDLYSKYPEYGRYVVENAAAIDASSYMMEHNIDPEVILKNSEYYDNLYNDPDNPQNKQYLDNAVEYYEDYQKYDKGSDFANFISNIHATMIHYLPALAYAEATVVKAVDATLEFLDDYIPGYDHAAKYEGQGIGDIASSIVTDADAQYEVKMELEQLAKDNDNNMHHSAEEYADAQQNQQDAQQQAYASNCEPALS